MKIYEIVDLGTAFEKLSSVDFGIKDAYKIKRMAVPIYAEIDIINKQRRDIFNSNNCTINPINGAVEFPDNETRQRVECELNELHNIDVELTLKPITIQYNENLVLSAKDLLSMDKFIKIEGLEDE